MNNWGTGDHIFRNRLQNQQHKTLLDPMGRAMIANIDLIAI
jgi:hypothetical protein